MISTTNILLILFVFGALVVPSTKADEHDEPDTSNSTSEIISMVESSDAMQNSYFSEGAFKMALKFIDRIDRSIKSKDAALFRGLFSPGFEVSLCNGTLNKEEVVKFLRRLSYGYPPAFALESVEELENNQTKLNITFTEMFEPDHRVEVILNNYGQQLDCGRILDCSLSTPWPKSKCIVTYVDTEIIIPKTFIEILETRDRSNILSLFNPGFTFEECEKKQTKDETVNMLMSLTFNTSTDYIITPMENMKTAIKFSVKASDFNTTDFDIELIINNNNQKLIFGRELNCPTPAPIPTEPILTPEEFLEKFMKDMTNLMEPYNETAFMDMLEEEFTFKSCEYIFKKKYTYDRWRPYFMRKATFKIESVYEWEATIRASVIVIERKETNFEIKLVFNMKNKTLESAVTVCENEVELDEYDDPYEDTIRIYASFFPNNSLSLSTQ